MEWQPRRVRPAADGAARLFIIEPNSWAVVSSMFCGLSCGGLSALAPQNGEVEVATFRPSHMAPVAQLQSYTNRGYKTFTYSRGQQLSEVSEALPGPPGELLYR